MRRREFLTAPVAFSAAVRALPSVKLGIDLFSLRGQNWSPEQYLKYCAARQVQVVHFSETRFLGNLETANLRSICVQAQRLGLSVEIGMKSICPTSKMFEHSAGTAEQQLGRMIEAAVTVGSPIVRAVLGSAEDRKPGPIKMHMDSMVQVLRASRSKAMDANVKIAIENHAGDMQARELKQLVEAAGPEFTGVCLDSGNPLWTLEDPNLTLETLYPYVLTSHLRDSAVWEVPTGAAVTWVQMGRGNVGIDGYVRRFVELCPSRPLSLESILFGPRVIPYRDPAFWDAYRDVRASEFERFVKIAERGKPYVEQPWETKDEAARERDALDESLEYLKKLVSGLQPATTA